jgi:hypothetical protein
MIASYEGYDLAKLLGLQQNAFYQLCSDNKMGEFYLSIRPNQNKAKNGAYEMAIWHKEPNANIIGIHKTIVVDNPLDFFEAHFKEDKLRLKSLEPVDISPESFKLGNCRDIYQKIAGAKAAPVFVPSNTKKLSWSIFGLSRKSTVNPKDITPNTLYRLGENKYFMLSANSNGMKGLPIFEETESGLKLLRANALDSKNTANEFVNAARYLQEIAKTQEKLRLASPEEANEFMKAFAHFVQDPSNPKMLTTFKYYALPGISRRTSWSKKEEKSLKIAVEAVEKELTIAVRKEPTIPVGKKLTIPVGKEPTTDKGSAAIPMTADANTQRSEENPKRGGRIKAAISGVFDGVTQRVNIVTQRAVNGMTQGIQRAVNGMTRGIESYNGLRLQQAGVGMDFVRRDLAMQKAGNNTQSQSTPDTQSPQIVKKTGSNKEATSQKPPKTLWSERIASGGRIKVAVSGVSVALGALGFIGYKMNKNTMPDNPVSGVMDPRAIYAIPNQPIKA